VALAEACIASGLGAQISLLPSAERWDRLLFGEGGARVLVSVPSGREGAWQALLAEAFPGESPPPATDLVRSLVGRIERIDWGHVTALYAEMVEEARALLTGAGADPATIAFPGNPVTTVIGGLLVGAGTVLGSGCTSGHGICGMSRLSQRSILSTLIFMAVALITVFLMRHVMGG
jgi:uncharacterized membrane protein YedE/YeeE